MAKALSQSEITEIYNRHVKMIYQICYIYLKNRADTEDAVSDVFVKLIKSSPQFKSDEHQKAWLIKTATNTCKDTLKHWWRKTKNIDNCGFGAINGGCNNYGNRYGDGAYNAGYGEASSYTDGGYGENNGGYSEDYNDNQPNTVGVYFDDYKKDDIINAVCNLPKKYKTVVHLYYYEGYNSAEISKILGKPKSTIRNYLHESRNILKEKLGGYFNEE